MHFKLVFEFEDQSERTKTENSNDIPAACLLLELSSSCCVPLNNHNNLSSLESREAPGHHSCFLMKGLIS